MHGKQAVPLSYISVLCVTGNSCVCVFKNECGCCLCSSVGESGDLYLKGAVQIHGRHLEVCSWFKTSWELKLGRVTSICSHGH